MLNLARQLVYPMDDFEGTIDYCYVHCLDGKFTLPYHIETIRNAYDCECRIDIEPGQWKPACPPYAIRHCLNFVRTDEYVVVPVNLRLGYMYGFRITDLNDAGIKFSVSYMNEGFGAVSEDVTLPSTLEDIVWLVDPVVRFYSINKPRTVGYIQLYARSPYNQCCLIYNYHPLETCPQYQVYYSNQFFGNCILIRGKKRFIPYTDKDYDMPLDIKSHDGLRFAMKAIEHEASGRLNEYSATLASARGHFEKDKIDVRSRDMAGLFGNWYPDHITSPINYSYG
jgi:hypothetical protein